jgi:hypothetical protein
MHEFTLMSSYPFVHSWLCCIHKSVRLRTAGIRGFMLAFTGTFPQFLSFYAIEAARNIFLQRTAYHTTLLKPSAYTQQLYLNIFTKIRFNYVSNFLRV